MSASATGLVAGLLIAVAFIAGGVNGLVLAILLGALGFVVGMLIGGETRSFRRYGRRVRR
ncbi:hypothetical protein GCM10009830_28350 [Glycomyces endophyticus]|uniref:DUF2273 domain-containing protein n=1 Tax=Glycomyces endophyticus TaxID=480996 RepID=A0ABN2H0Q5_9ACTN